MVKNLAVREGVCRIGYVVVDTGPHGRVMALDSYDDTPRGGILVNGDWATMFATRAQAKGAIKRSRDYSLAQNYNWRTDLYEIQTIRSR